MRVSRQECSHLDCSSLTSSYGLSYAREAYFSLMVSQCSRRLFLVKAEPAASQSQRLGEQRSHIVGRSQSLPDRGAVNPRNVLLFGSLLVSSAQSGGASLPDTLSDSGSGTGSSFSQLALSFSEPFSFCLWLRQLFTLLWMSGPTEPFCVTLHPFSHYYRLHLG